MHIRGRLGREAPDPAIELLDQLRRLPVTVFGLVPQRHLEDWDGFALTSLTHGDTLESCAVSISYTLWRNPEYIDDPANLAVLDDDTRAHLDRELPPDRPRWLLERLRRMRYPMLWECVTTHWRAEPPAGDSADETVEARLAAHVNHVLMNGFRDSRVHGGLPGEIDSPVDERHAEHGVTLRVNGFEWSGIRIDTDPDVYGVGVTLDATTCVTAVVPRDELRFVDLAFATRRI